jgi:hypothetical protein
VAITRRSAAVTAPAAISVSRPRVPKKKQEAVAGDAKHAHSHFFASDFSPVPAEKKGAPPRALDFLRPPASQEWPPPQEGNLKRREKGGERESEGDGKLFGIHMLSFSTPLITEARR